uniref:Uncharacterized protein n=1 Tax=Aegilops tauschii subsp. strangulata TaxID=200361 RepID=A0A453KV82_AEGTS
MCGGAILAGFIPPSAAAAAAKAAAAKKKQQQRSVTADSLWPGLRKKAAEEEDFEADFRDFERDSSDDDAVVEEVPPPPASAGFAFAAAAEVAPPAPARLGETRGAHSTCLPPLLLYFIYYYESKRCPRLPCVAVEERRCSTKSLPNESTSDGRA